jgi:hypothetical protein
MVFLPLFRKETFRSALPPGLLQACRESWRAGIRAEIILPNNLTVYDQLEERSKKQSVFPETEKETIRPP